MASPAEFQAVFNSLKTVFARHEKRLALKTDTPVEYTLVTKSASPFPQHKGEPLFFSMIRIGKGYVSFHLMPIYMCPELAKEISPELKKRMQGKACFNFKTDPSPETLDDLKRLTNAALDDWKVRNWL